jgi:DNA-binding transcriptional ArsR family regulator
MTNLVDIISFRVKAELLRLLFGLRQPELHLRELGRQSGLSLGTVQQELRRLTRVGLVTARKDGNRIYYRANPDHPVHRDLSALVPKTDGLGGVLQPALKTPEVILAIVQRDLTDAVGDISADWQFGIA